MDLQEKADRFLDLFRDLALGYNRELDLPQMLSYFGVLKELEIHALADAAVRLRKTSQFFPSAAEWHRVATAITIDRMEDVPVPTPAGGKHCGICQDTGFAPGYDPRYVKLCSCRPTNPELARQRAVTAKMRGMGE